MTRRTGFVHERVLVLVLGVLGGIASGCGGGEGGADGGVVDGGVVDVASPDAAPDAMPDEPRLHTIVVYNPTVADSQSVALWYAMFRQIPSDRLCAAAAPNMDVLDAADADAFFAAVQACRDGAEGAGADIQYLVPVYGVPYKVAGRIRDPYTTAVTTVSLDAVLAFGPEAPALEVATANPIYRLSDSPTATYPDYVPFAEQRAAAGEPGLLIVARIDGADADAARTLVDRTENAEALAAAGGLAGTVYVDGNRGLPHPASDGFGSYEDGEWDIAGVEAVFDALGWYPVVADYDNAEFGTAPAPLLCPDALYYAGWYSFGHYNDVFTWTPGAIGGHLDSCSACDIRVERDWSAVALRRGITATFGAVNEPYVVGMPDYDAFFHFLTHGATFGEAGYASTFWGAWMMVWVGDPLYRPHPAE